ncbi:MAG TPA: hypothetical protein VGI03_11630 [Verrucomicrobiae bacterium]|jgi:hypothetical protein
MSPNLSGVKFEDATKVFIKTPLPKSKNQPNKMGRPKLSKKEKRGVFISTRISPREYAEIVQAAKESGISKTKWVRTKLVAAARRA